MVKRPLKSKRPIGPLKRPIGPLFSESDLRDANLTEEESKVMEQAQEWFNSISNEHVKRKYMKNYLSGITDDSFSERRIERMLDEVGL